MSDARPTRAALGAALEQVEAELQTAQQELARWELRVAELRRQALQFQAEYQAALQQALVDELRALHGMLNESAAAWRRRHVQQQQAAQLQAELAAQLANDAGLAAALHEYDDAVAQRDKLNEFPEGMRGALLQLFEEKLAELAARSAGYHALKQQHDTFLQGEALTLQLACTTEDGQLWHWITPWPANTDDGADTHGVQQLMAALSGLGRSERWTIDDIDNTVWQGRQVITLLADYHGGATDDALHDAAQQLRETLQQGQQQLQVSVSRLAGDLWQLRERPIQPQAVEGAGEGADGAPTSLQSDWFNAADLRSWTRRASKRMGPAQRRMRTLVVRLLAHGHISNAGVSLTGLLDGLPERHAAALRGDITLLRQRQLLLDSTESDHLTLNPAALDDYRALILRDPGDAWSFLTRV